MGAPSSWLNLCTKSPHLKWNQARQQENNILTLSLHHYYGKIPKISPVTYIFQRLFLSGLFLEGLVDRGKFVSKFIRLAYTWKEIYCFCFVLLRIRGQFPSIRKASVEAYILRGDLTEGFCVTGLWDLYLEGLIFGILRCFSVTFCSIKP